MHKNAPIDSKEQIGLKNQKKKICKILHVLKIFNFPVWKHSNRDNYEVIILLYFNQTR